MLIVDEYLKNRKEIDRISTDEVRKGGIAVTKTHPPFSPLASQNLPANLPGAIRQHMKARRIWQALGGCFLLNDEFSRQVRRDTLRFRIDEKYRIGK